ncbi:Gfo/Idh/MocA family oxidoreductase [candidate division KSB1 bacterium]|nr:Gfo/Idh/MocA family oxidoreductase [candidate division KSB1 bacterium]
MANPIDVTIIGGGMITNDTLLPSIYHLQRTGMVKNINICALNSEPLKALKQNPELAQAFPGQDFNAYPSLSEAPEKKFPDLYKDVIAAMAPRQAVVIAVPDQLHYQIVKAALDADQHILCVKPLVLKYTQAAEIEKIAYDKGLFVGIEYHKRFDQRALIAKRDYQLGKFGSFVMGEAKLIEPYYYLSSNFQNWFTTQETDPFVYIGCHYVDLVYFITGLKPVEVSVAGVIGTFPNGNEGYFWANGRVRFENNALLTVINGLGYPDEGAGSNEQCLSMFCEGEGRNGVIKHDDQFRGVSHGYATGFGPGNSRFNFVNPDFFKIVPWEGAGYKPAGYGYDSVEALLGAIHRIETETASLPENKAKAARQNLIREIDAKGILATPNNSYINELVIEAARLSILSDGLPVKILYGDNPHVELR